MSPIEAPQDNTSQIKEDFQQIIQSYEEIGECMAQVAGSIGKVTQDIQIGQLPTSQGLSILEVKNNMMIQYLMNLTYLIGLKCGGRSIEREHAIERIVEIRTVLERIWPIDQKLKYQIEKMVKTVLTGEMDENDPSRFRANPANMMNKLNDGSDEEEDNNEDEEEDSSKIKTKKDKNGVYVPPKLAAVHYEDDDKQSTRKQKEEERARKRALHSSVIQELREEYLDTPMEVAHASAMKAKISRHQQEKREYEETFFTRLPTTRKDKHKSRQMTTMGNLGDQLTHFEDIGALEGRHASGGKRKRKSKASKSKKQKTKKRKFH